jgi:hypothetical protein
MVRRTSVFGDLAQYAVKRSQELGGLLPGGSLRRALYARARPGVRGHQRTSQPNR